MSKKRSGRDEPLRGRIRRAVAERRHPMPGWRTAAAAVCWVIGKANDSFEHYGSGVWVKDLMAHFGLSGSVSQRAEVMLRALDIGWSYGSIDLGDPALLVSARRTRIAEQRDRLRKQIDEQADDVS